jgi:hypothetical protein
MWRNSYGSAAWWLTTPPCFAGCSAMPPSWTGDVGRLCVQLTIHTALMKPTSRSKKQWHYLYRAVDSTGATLDFMLSPTRHAEAAERFFRKVLRASHTCTPRVITVDKNAAYPPACEVLQQEGTLPETCLLRLCTYLNRLKMDSRELISHRLFRVTYLASGTCSLEVKGRYWCHDTHTISHRRRQMF